MQTEKCASAQTLELTLPPRLMKPRLNRLEASEYLAEAHGLTVASSSLAKLASTGGGPKFQKFNNSPMYPRDQLDAWAIEKLGPLVASTSEL